VNPSEGPRANLPQENTVQYRSIRYRSISAICIMEHQDDVFRQNIERIPSIDYAT
jgi:hypothetical protein